MSLSVSEMELAFFVVLLDSSSGSVIAVSSDPPSRSEPVFLTGSSSSGDHSGLKALLLFVALPGSSRFLFLVAVDDRVARDVGVWAGCCCVPCEGPDSLWVLADVYE